MIILQHVDEAVRYVIAPAGTPAKNLGQRLLHEDREEALTVAEGLNQAVYAVTVTVTQITRL